ncbi:MAG: dihydroorotate dehydrogenase [Chlamydiae bacterium]|nr:dihydroorotate dehydrogenase [Chlamydiota bacterium]MBI3277852.1 dihydroorotate dehydrogenase [Chlamydiota bacterium]
MNLSVQLGRLKLKNPVTVASGTYGYGEEFSELVDLNQLGGIAVKGLTLKPRKGNPPQRIVETPSGMLNSIGLQNVGVDTFIEKKIPFLKKFDTQVIANINGVSDEEYEELAKRLEPIQEVAALEINLSCPNVKEGGIHFGSKPDKIYEVTSRVRKAFSRGVLTKLSPNVTDIVPMAEAVEAAGADGISMVNTLVGMAIDVERRQPVLKSITGGLSGPAIKPIALRMVYEVHSKLDIPILGMGGIATVEDALEFLMAGATAISIGTANFYNPLTPLKILDGLKKYMEKFNFKKISEITGSLKVNQ